MTERRVIRSVVFIFILCVMPTYLSAYSPDGYIGCYHTLSLVILYRKRSSTNSGDKCMQFCLNKGFRYAATRSNLCYCGNQLSDNQKYSIALKCYEECPGNKNEVCGGLYEEISLYDISQTTLTTSPPTTTTTTTTITTTSVRIEVNEKVGLHTTEVAATNTSNAVTITAIQSWDGQYNHILILVFASVGVIGMIVIVNIVICKCRKRKQKPVYCSNTSRDEITAKEVKVSNDDDGEHIYDHCADPEAGAYQGNGGYLTPVVGTLKWLHEDPMPLGRKKEKVLKHVNNVAYTNTARTEDTYEKLVKDNTVDKSVYSTVCYN